MLGGHDGRDRVFALAHQVGRAAQDPRALDRGQGLPRLERRGGSVDRGLDIGASCVRNRADRVARRRVGDVEPATIGRLDPLAADQESLVVSSHYGHDGTITPPAVPAEPGEWRAMAERLAEVADGEGVDPPYLHEEYVSTRLRAPSQPLLLLPRALGDLGAPVFGDAEEIDETDHDLTGRYDGRALGQRIVVSGRVLEEGGRPVAGSLVEIWQANASGRYRHDADRHGATLDPNFDGAGRCLTDSEGRYRFVTVKPGCYPWPNHANAWRPAHIHFSLFGRAFSQRLVTQMYFPDDPLFPYDPIYGSIRDPKARERLISRFDLETTMPDEALGFTFDIVLRSTPFEDQDHEE